MAGGTATPLHAGKNRTHRLRADLGGEADGVEADLALLCHAGLTVQAVTHELSMQAGRIRSRRYHRERAAVSLADCVAAAAALATGSPLATSDPALAEVLRSEGGKVHVLPDSKGTRALGPRHHRSGVICAWVTVSIGIWTLGGHSGKWAARIAQGRSVPAFAGTTFREWSGRRPQPEYGGAPVPLRPGTLPTTAPSRSATAATAGRSSLVPTAWQALGQPGPGVLGGREA